MRWLFKNFTLPYGGIIRIRLWVEVKLPLSLSKLPLNFLF